MTLYDQLLALRQPLAAAAQGFLDAWQQDDDGFDPWLGTGGACDEVAHAFADCLAERLAGASTADGGQPGDNHAWLIVYTEREACGLDLPADVYEEGGGYRWRKLDGVVVRPADIQVWRIDRADLDLGEEAA